MSKKMRIIIISYASAALLALGLYSAVASRSLKSFRAAAQYSSERAFGEVCAAVDGLNETLSALRYATDGQMCARLCSRAYADSLAAEAALAVLPFETQQLESVSAFFALAGDYTGCLCHTAADGLTDEQRETLEALSVSAAQYADALSACRTDLDNAVLRLDSREKRLANVSDEAEQGLVSESLSDIEASACELCLPRYEGRYTAFEPERSFVPEARSREAAAGFIGREADELQLEYETADGLRCYSFDGMYLTLSGETVTGAASSRLICEGRMSEEEAAAAAAKLLERLGMTGLALEETESNGLVAKMSFVPSADGAICVDEAVTVSVALDNGGLYGFSAKQYPSEGELVWTVTEDDAAATLPASLSLQSVRRIVSTAPSGKRTACYELECLNAQGERVTVLVNAETGRQEDIRVEMS